MSPFAGGSSWKAFGEQAILGILVLVFTGQMLEPAGKGKRSPNGHRHKVGMSLGDLAAAETPL